MHAENQGWGEPQEAEQFLLLSGDRGNLGQKATERRKEHKL